MSTTTASANKDSAAVESLADRVAEATEAATSVARDATEAATDVARQADRTLRDSPDEALGMVGALSVGMAIGMVATNAPRIMIAAALVPAAFVAWLYLQRSDRGARGTSR